MTTPDRTRFAFAAELYDATTAPTRTQRREHLDRAHTLARPHRWLHLRCHLAMIAAALRDRDGGTSVFAAGRAAAGTVTCGSGRESSARM